jgi:hypothetical protein
VRGRSKVAISETLDGEDMERALAVSMMSTLMQLSENCNEVASFVEQVSNDDERKRLRRPLGDLMGLVYTDLMLPILREYPELDPDKK